MKLIFSKNRILALVGVAVLAIAVIISCNHHYEVIGADAETTAENVEPTKEKYMCLGEFKLTAYCGCEKCCGKWGENRPIDSTGNPIVLTAGGYRAVEGITIAADTNLFPIGTKMYIGDHEYTVQDKGGSVKGNRIDIYFENHQDALNFGVQYDDVYVKVVK